MLAGWAEEVLPLHKLSARPLCHISHKVCTQALQKGRCSLSPWPLPSAEPGASGVPMEARILRVSEFANYYTHKMFHRMHVVCLPWQMPS